ncbi:MAG: F0F1 ATP synthase subunit alpha [candidate division SR1 bacterium CG_4_9_14_3_um_filter_40_9]|nr:MAG: F0F1 ATP synthase subunit alpha [candidate division SR1 bacterium CG_4_9_14_3_um_filter_40_9]
MQVVKEILDRIEQDIKNADIGDSFSKKGEILELKDGVAIVVGLDDAMFSEIVEFENGIKGLVLDLSNDSVGILVLGDYSKLRQGDTVRAVGKVLSVGVGEEYLGRVLDGIGMPIDGLADIKPKTFNPVEKIAPGVITRQGVNKPLETGIKAIDTMVPIGRGQRELIIGNRQTGKTTIGTDTILNQKGKDVICIYVSIGQKEGKVRRIVETLKEKDAMKYTIVVSAPANSPSVLQYIAPYVGCALGEFFMAQGKDALIIYDDLSKHAVAYREVSLLLRRPPGREAYPGDVFYLHSRLLERAANLNKDFGGGSLTALPIIETLDSDVSAYIPTNVISITDGQIFLETELFNSGIRPAIDVGLSVSRVGGSAQTKIMKKVAGKLRLELASFRELASFAQFASDLDESTQRKIEKGKRLVEMLKQPNNDPIPFNKQVVLIYAGINDYLNDLPVNKVLEFEKLLYLKLDTVYADLTKKIIDKKTLEEDIEKEMIALIKETREEMKI